MQLTMSDISFHNHYFVIMLLTLIGRHCYESEYIKLSQLAAMTPVYYIKSRNNIIISIAAKDLGPEEL